MESDTLTPQGSSDTVSTESQGFDVDSVMANIESSPDGNYRPEKATQEAKATEAPKAPQATQPNQTEYEITVSGKKIKAPLDKILQWASQGRDYPQKMQEMNRQRFEFEQRQKQLQELEAKYKPYSEIDEFFTKNPDKYARIKAEFSGQPISTNPTDGSIDPYSEKFQQIEKEIEPVKQFLNEFKQKQAEETRLKEDQMLSEEIKSIQEMYPDMDFQSPNEEGKSLEWRVLEHAQALGLTGKGAFRAAFRDLTFEDHLKRTEAQALEKQKAAAQKNSRLGLLGSNPAPMKSPAKAVNKNMTYSEIVAEVLREKEAGVTQW